MNDINVFVVEDDLVMSAAIEHAVLSVKSDIKISKFTSIMPALSNTSFPPDIIFLDHYLENSSGLEAIPAILNLFPKAVIAVDSAQENVELFTEAYKNGASVYFKKDENSLDKIAKFVQNWITSKDREAEKGFFHKLLEQFETFNSKTSDSNKIKSVVVIEDDEIFTFAIQYTLRQMNKINFDSYVDLEHFLNSPLKSSLDIIILDYNLNEAVLGSQDIDKLKTKYPTAKIVMLSANSDVKIAEQLKSYGVDYYLHKSNESLAYLGSIIMS